MLLLLGVESQEQEGEESYASDEALRNKKKKGPKSVLIEADNQKNFVYNRSTCVFS